MIVVMNQLATKKEVREVVESINASTHDIRVTRLNGRVVIVANGNN